jgi:hypothetical protein
LAGVYVHMKDAMASTAILHEGWTAVQTIKAKHPVETANPGRVWVIALRIPAPLALPIRLRRCAERYRENPTQRWMWLSTIWGNNANGTSKGDRTTPSRTSASFRSSREGSQDVIGVAGIAERDLDGPGRDANRHPYD